MAGPGRSGRRRRERPGRGRRRQSRQGRARAGPQPRRTGVRQAKGGTPRRAPVGAHGNGGAGQGAQAAEAASAALAKANATCEHDLVDAAIADDVVVPRGEEERCKIRLQAAESALAAKRAALEESAKANAEAARLAKEVHEEATRRRRRRARSWTSPRPSRSRWRR